MVGVGAKNSSTTRAISTPSHKDYTGLPFCSEPQMNGLARPLAGERRHELKPYAGKSLSNHHESTDRSRPSGAEIVHRRIA